MCKQKNTRWRQALRGERGDFPIAYAIAVPMLVVLGGTVFDVAGKVQADTEATAVAQSAARAGANAGVPSDVTGAGNSVWLSSAMAASGAQSYLSATGLQGSVVVDGTRVSVHVVKPYRTKFISLINVTQLMGEGDGVAEVRTGG